jgi:hypothetical protein
MEENVAMLRSLFPSPVGPHPVWPTVYETLLIHTLDIGHEAETYYKLGYRTISRHEKHALLCKEETEGPALLKFVIMVQE